MNIFEYHELSVLLETVPRFRLRWKMVNHRQTLVLEGSIVTDNWGAMRHSIHDEDKSPLNDHSMRVRLNPTPYSGHQTQRRTLTNSTPELSV